MQYKIKFTLKHTMIAHRGWVVNALPGKETRYPLYKRSGWLQGRSGRVRKIAPPPGFDSRTVQPAASCYTDYVIPAHMKMKEIDLLIM
jgi:hypothetical protein